MRRGIGRLGLALAVALAAATAVLVLAPVLPRILPRILTVAAHVAGDGETITATQHLADDWYVITWTARSGSRPTQGCLFGLRLDQVRPDITPGPKEGRFSPLPPKLSYRTVPARATVTGSSGIIRLEGGDYRFIVEGGCAWEVTVTQSGEPPPTPSSSDDHPRM